MWSKKPFFQRIFFIFPYANFLPTGINYPKRRTKSLLQCSSLYLYTKYMQVYYDLMIDEYKQTYLNLRRIYQSNFAKTSHDIFRLPEQDRCNS